jgi:hypothetical protein
MGLLDDLPYGLLNQIWNGTQSRTPNGNFSANEANGLPSRVLPQQQRLPLSFAGPDLTGDITAASPGWSADFLRAQPPAPPAQNLTVQALRMKGVPEADISAAMGNPEVIKGLVIQHFGPGPTSTAARTGLASDQGNASRGLFSDSSQRAYPEASQFDDPRARRDTPTRSRLMSGDPTGRSAAEINLYRADGNPALNPSPTPPAGPVPLTQIAAAGPRCDGFDAGCHAGGTYGTNGLYSINGKNYCESCAVKVLRIEDLGSVQKTKALGKYIGG